MVSGLAAEGRTYKTRNGILVPDERRRARKRGLRCPKRTCEAMAGSQKRRGSRLKLPGDEEQSGRVDIPKPGGRHVHAEEDQQLTQFERALKNSCALRSRAIVIPVLLDETPFVEIVSHVRRSADRCRKRVALVSLHVRRSIISLWESRTGGASWINGGLENFFQTIVSDKPR
jgi:hypothetical protein